MANLRWDGNDFRNEQDSSGSTADLVSHSGKLQQGYQHGSLTRGLVAYYPMEKGEGEVLHDGALNNLGQIKGATWNGSGQVGTNSLSFAASESVISKPVDEIHVTSNASFSLWFKADDVSSGQVLVENIHGDSSNDRFSIMLGDTADGEVSTRVYDGSSYVKSGGNIATSSWHHVAVVWGASSKTVSLYLDGSELTGTNTQSIGNKNGFSIGKQTATASPFYHFDGKISEVRLYDRVLSQPEIQALYNLSQPSGVKRTEKNVPGQNQGGVSRYKFNGTVNDSWGSNDGTDKTSVSPSYTTGVYGQAKNFDGTDDYVRLESSSSSFDFLASSYNISIAFWFKFSSSSDFSTLVNGYEDGGRGWFTGEVSGNMRGRWREPSSGNTDQVETSKSYDDGNWHHYVCRRTGGTADDIDIFIDGKNESLNTISNDGAGTWSPSGSVDIGARFDANNSNVNNYSGELDDVRLYNTALTPTQVEKLYHKGAYRVPRESTLQ